jgi:hypothetical protein
MDLIAIIPTPCSPRKEGPDARRMDLTAMTSPISPQRKERLMRAEWT